MGEHAGRGQVSQPRDTRWAMCTAYLVHGAMAEVERRPSISGLALEGAHYRQWRPGCQRAGAVNVVAWRGEPPSLAIGIGKEAAPRLTKHASGAAMHAIFGHVNVGPFLQHVVQGKQPVLIVKRSIRVCAIRPDGSLALGALVLLRQVVQGLVDERVEVLHFLTVHARRALRHTDKRGGNVREGRMSTPRC